MKNSKKILAIVLVFAMIFSITCFSTATVVQAHIGWDIWDGTRTETVNGTGSEEDPYLISTPEEFAYIVRYGLRNEYAKLTSDIYLNDTTKIDWQDGTVEEGYVVNQWYNEKADISAFSGVLDGDGHTVYGLYITNETENIGFGLFPLIQEGGANPTTIKNLGVDYAYVNAPNGYAGAFAGKTKWDNTTTFDTCYVGENVTVIGKEAGLFYGRGGAGVAILNSYSLGTVTGTTCYGVVGNCWGNTRIIDNSFFNARITSTIANSITCTNTYATDSIGAKSGAVQLTSDQMQGLDALTNAGKLSALAECGAFTATESYPILSIFNKELDIWDGTESAPAAGTGTEEDPYLISTPEQFAYIISHYASSLKYYKLTTDIYLNDITKINWQNGTVAADYTVNQWYIENNGASDKESTSPAFYGVLDGDGHTVYGLYISDDATNVRMGLIPWVQEGAAYQTTIKNLGVDCAYVNAPNGYAGAIVGRNRQNNTTTFDTCNVGEDVTVNGLEAGLFCGRGNAGVAIFNCYSLGTVTGTNYYGVVGNCAGSTRTIDNSFFVNTPITTSGSSHRFTCTNVYATNITGGTGAVQLTSDNMQGWDALSNESKMSDLAGCLSFLATESYPVLLYSQTKHTVTFNPNGGTVSTGLMEAIVGATMKLPEPFRGGFIFKAWYTDAEFTTQATNIMPEEDMTYYAKWYKLWDVNDDADVNSSDLIQLRKLLLGAVSLEIDQISIDGADCNQNGEINITDLVRLEKVQNGVYIRPEYLGNIKTSGQDGAIFGNYLFHFDSQGQCNVYLLDEISDNSVPISVFTLDKVNTIRPHSNSVMFSNSYYDENDEFPLLYSNVYNNYAQSEQERKGVTCVYRVKREDNIFSTTLVQVIEIGFTEDSLWKSDNYADVRPYGNFTIDTQNSRYYAFTMRDQANKTRYFSFNLPDVNSGDYDETLGVKHVVLGTTDIINRFDCDYHRYLQGACFENGIIYSLEGFTNDKKNPPAIRLIDTNAKTQRKIYYLSDSGLTIEPEFIDFKDGICYYADHRGSLYKLTF